MPDLVCAACNEPVVANASSYQIFERMHWSCFHYSFEHSIAATGPLDRDIACAVTTTFIDDPTSTLDTSCVAELEPLRPG